MPVFLKAGLLFHSTFTITPCQTTGGATDAGTAAMCDKCKTAWVRLRTNIGGGGKGGRGVTTYHDARVMKCPERDNAIVAFVKTGQLQHRCTHCGGTMTHCTVH